MIDKSDSSPTQERPVRVLAFYAENVMNLRVAEFSPHPHVNVISGPNMSGKSSLINSVMYGLAGAKTHPAHMVRMGEDRMMIRLVLGDQAPELTAVRTATAEGETDLRLEAETGAVIKKPQHILDAMEASSLAWDAIGFMAMDRKAQMEVLRNLVKVDIDLDAVDGEILKLMEARRLHRPTIGPLLDRKVRLWPTLDADMDITPISTRAQLDALEQASAHNATIEQEKARRVDQSTQAREKRIQAENLREQARRLIEQANAFDAAASAIEFDLETAGPIAEPIDMTALRADLDAAEAEKAKREAQARARVEYAEVYDQHRKAVAEEKEMTDAIESLRREKREAIARTKMPIAGLSFDDDGVTFNHLPLSQASQAEQWRVVIAIGMAMNPRLRVIFIREGSLLDSTQMKIVCDLAEEWDFQLFIELVDETGMVGIHMREGRIAFIDGKPVIARPELVSA